MEFKLPKKKVIAYYTFWSTGERNYLPGDLPLDKITHLNYAFANISSEGTIEPGNPAVDLKKPFPGEVRGSYQQLNKVVKKKYPHIKTLISVGGWIWSGRFSDIALTRATRAKFADSVVEFIREYGFDGIDVDWEYPVGGGLTDNTCRPEDKRNFTLLLAELRDRLIHQEKNDNRKYLLTAATPAGYNHYENNYELEEAVQFMDWVNVMTYDLHSAWDKYTNHQAAFSPNPLDPSPALDREKRNVQDVVQGYIDRGVPCEKIILGIPFYGRGMRGVPPENSGLFQTHKGVATGTWDDEKEPEGIFDYSDIHKKILEGKMKDCWDEDAGASYTYSENDGIFITYDNPRAVRLKCRYVKANNLGGVMFWEASGDLRDSDDEDSLIKAIYQELVTGDGSLSRKHHKNPKV